MLGQGRHVIGPPVGQLGFGAMPHALIGIQLGGIGREVLHVQAGEGPTEVTNARPPMDATVVPEHDQRAAQVSEQVAQECADRSQADVCRVQLVGETEVSAARADRYGRDHGESVVALPEAEERRLPSRRPCLADARNQEEARFVEEDEVGTQPRGVFFTRGQS